MRTCHQKPRLVSPLTRLLESGGDLHQNKLLKPLQTTEVPRATGQALRVQETEVFTSSWCIFSRKDSGAVHHSLRQAMYSCASPALEVRGDLSYQRRTHGAGDVPRARKAAQAMLHENAQEPVALRQWSVDSFQYVQDSNTTA